MKIDKLKDSILIIVAFILGGVLTYVVVNGNLTTSSKGTTSSGGATCSSKNCTKVLVDGSGISQSVSKVYDGVVIVRNYQNNELAGFGTGFVYKEDDKYDYLITNHHVIDGNNKVTVVTSKEEELDAEVLGSDSYVDIAVIRIKKNKDLTVLSIGTSENSKLGDLVFTIGTPVSNEYQGSVSTGHLAGKDRMVTVSTSSNGYSTSSGDWVMKVLQTDASINPGNSGGPLMNSNGEVIGVISMKLVKEEIEGMGFAIPIEYAMSKIETLEKGEEIKWPQLGVQMVNVSDVKQSRFGSNYNIPNDVKTGVVVAGIVSGTGASKSDLKEGDIITKLNGEEVENAAYLRYELYKYAPGDTITLTYLRDGKEHETKAVLSKSE